MKIRPPIKVHGGKYFLSDWIITHFPINYTNMTYVEPYCGGANVLLKKTKSKREVLSDIDIGVYSIFQVLQNHSKEFIQLIQDTPYCEDTFRKAQENKEYTTEIQCAVNEFILRRMSRGGLKQHFAWSDRQRGGQPGDVNAWQTIVAHLPQIHQRLCDVEIYNKPAMEIIDEFDDENTLLYLDPPYLPDVRTSKQIYDHEMTAEDHCKLGERLQSFKGKVVISGYMSSLYENLYKTWRSRNRLIVNHSSQQKNKPHRTEYIWLNYAQE